MLRLISHRDVAKPFFLYAAFQNTHSPITAPQPLIDKCTAHGSVRPEFCGDVLALDGAVGSLFNELKALGMYNNSVIVFTTDNGASVNMGGNNLPLRGGKFTLWDGGTKGVAFVHSPLLPLSRQGTRWPGLMHACDWFATLFEAADLVLGPNSTAIDSMSMWSAFAKGTSSPRSILVHQVDGNGIGKIRVEGWNLYVGDPSNNKGGSGWTPPGGKVPYFPGNCSNTPCLFRVGPVLSDDLAPVPDLDIAERHDLAAQYPDIVKNLTSMLQAAICNDCAGDKLPKTANTSVCDGYRSFGALSPYYFP